MPRVVPLDALWQKPLAAALAPPGKRGAAALGFHACTKSMLAFTRALRWLISAFHKGRQVFDAI
jgi:hypothetical protein